MIIDTMLAMTHLKRYSTKNPQQQIRYAHYCSPRRVSSIDMPLSTRAIDTGEASQMPNPRRSLKSVARVMASSRSASTTPISPSSCNTKTRSLED